MQKKGCLSDFYNELMQDKHLNDMQFY